MNSLFSSIVLTLKRYLPSKVYNYGRAGYHCYRKGVMIGKRKLFSEIWLAKRVWNKSKRKRDAGFFSRMENDYSHLRRSLTEGELIKLSDYTSKYNKIKVYIWENNGGFAGICSDYMMYLNDWHNSDENTCSVLFLEGLLEGTFFTCNKYLVDKIQQKFETITSESYSFWYAYLKSNQDRVALIDTHDVMKWMYEEAKLYFQTGDKIVHSFLFSFSKDEEQRGQKQIKELGIEVPYICIFARDPRFCQEIRHAGNTGYSLRDSDIDSFKLTTQYFWKQHVQTVRMGAVVQSSYCCEGAIDYANHGRTDFLDLYIFSKCKFFVSGASGITTVTHLLNIPVAIINLPCLLVTHIDRNMPMEIGIYMKFYDPCKKRFLRLREMTDIQIMVFENLFRPRQPGGADAYDEYMTQHYEIIYNSPEEILDLAKEMEAIQNKTIHYTEHDEELQRRYRRIVLSYFSMYPSIIECVFLGRIGMQWLRDNEWFLE